MMREPFERRDAEGVQTAGIVAAAVAAVVLLVLLGACWLAAQITGTGQGSPAQWVRAWFDDRPAWSSSATALVLVSLVVVAVVTALAARQFGLWARWLDWRRRRRVDRMARHLSAREDEEELRQKACQRKADRWGVPPECGPGLPLGKSVAFKAPLFSDFELTMLALMGPRIGKTSALCIPQVCAFNGGPAVVATNKRDLCDHTRGVRSRLGRVFVHDVQQIVQEKPSWTWDPLGFIAADDAKVARAQRLAGTFQACDGNRKETDAYFGPGGETLLANLMLAATLQGHSILATLDWLADLKANNEAAALGDPVEILAEHGYGEMSRQLKADRSLTPKQLDGLVGTARQIMAFLRDPVVHQWVVADATRRPFDPAAFVTSTDTLYLLSMNEAGSARPVVTALVMAVTDAAIKQAQRSGGGRLARPMLLMLDEAANICPWPELPDKYSYLGSHGIIPVTILQNRAQGVKAWGAEGMEQLESSASVMLVGGGLRSTRHLQDLSALIGQRTERVTTASRGKAHRSRGEDFRRVDIFSTAQLANFPRMRAVAFTAGARPVLIKLVPWWQGPHAESIAASNEHYAPADVRAQQRAIAEGTTRKAVAA
ncbi:type IV secretory system conjugative DNA transfer family protein [Luteipulveratus halotolerans]|uniref:TraD/TraG TraM recognition site domain-containing protein n=1 Tax=Luteipulveratus halotolerans TaxID=1631356 RepID=A0A0L6CQ86_9MICO|nr:TraM recognition domain-containing protein [Luteipulveratus halotolerans]KNX39703.1 hypothetical protein VV01_00255 [Luteipulveratus halotolerans]